MRTTHLHTAAAAGVLLLAFSGCAGSATSTPATTSTPKMSYDDGLLTFEIKRAPDGSYAASLLGGEGLLSFEDGCVRVGGYPLAVVRPASWDGQTLTVGERSFALGDSLSMGGTYRTELIPGQPDECTGETFFAHSVQLSSDVH
jgi:hypothetical protein